MFNRKPTATEPEEFIPSYEPKTSTLDIIIPANVMSSDVNLSNIDLKEVEKGSLIEAVKIRRVYWFEQQKGMEQGTRRPKKVSKFVFHFTVCDGKDITQELFDTYFMTDIFFDVNTGVYTAKTLGSYNSIPKILSANYQYNGTLKHDFDLHSYAPITSIAIVGSDTQFERKANPLYFWMELPSLFAN